jgi:hypothetical protein
VFLCVSDPSHSRHQGVASARLCSPVFHTWSDERNAPINQVQLFYFCSVFSHVLEFVSCISSDLSSFPRNSGTFWYRCISLQRRLALPQCFFTCKTGVKPIVVGSWCRSFHMIAVLGRLFTAVRPHNFFANRTAESACVECYVGNNILINGFKFCEYARKSTPFGQGRLFALFCW